MNISKAEQRTLHALAQGGHILTMREGTKFTRAECYTRDGYVLVDCKLATFKRLRRRGAEPAPVLAGRGGVAVR